MRAPINVLILGLASLGLTVACVKPKTSSLNCWGKNRDQVRCQVVINGQKVKGKTIEECQRLLKLEDPTIPTKGGTPLPVPQQLPPTKVPPIACEVVIKGQTFRGTSPEQCDQLNKGQYSQQGQGIPPVLTANERYVPVCKGDSISNKDFMLSYGPGSTAGWGYMTLEGGTGFSCKINPAATTEKFLPSCAEACGDQTQDAAVWGWCEGVAGYSCKIAVPEAPKAPL